MLSSISVRRQISSPTLFCHEKFLFSSLNHTFLTKPSSSLLNPNDKQSCPNPKFLSTTSSASTPTCSIEFNETTIRETLSSYSNDWKRAMEFFNWVETDCQFHHTTDTFNRIIDILGKFFEFDLSWDLIERMKHNAFSYPNHTTFRVLFKRYVSAHLVNEAINMYDHRLYEFNLKDDTSFSNLIDALCEYKHVIEAENLCLTMSNDLKLNGGTKLYNMILRGWFKIGWWSKCRDFWEEMDQRGVHKDLHSYSIYMDIMCKSGKPWKAINLYKEMKKKRMKLDAVAYNTVIQAVGLSQGVDFSIRIYREMIELGCSPTVVTFNTIIKLLCNNGRFKEAYALFDQMDKKGCTPNVITFHSIFGCLEKPREILGLFDRMIEIGIRPRIETYVMLIRKFGRWGFLRPVFIVWEKMEEQGCSPDECAYTALIDALVQKGMIEMARKFDEEMLTKGVSAKSRVELGLKVLNKQPCERYIDR